MTFILLSLSSVWQAFSASHERAYNFPGFPLTLSSAGLLEQKDYWSQPSIDFREQCDIVDMWVTPLTPGIVGSIKLNGIICGKCLLSFQSECPKNVSIFSLLFKPLTKHSHNIYTNSLHLIFIIASGSHVCLSRLKGPWIQIFSHTSFYLPRAQHTVGSRKINVG